MKFDQLGEIIQQVHMEFSYQAGRSINKTLTLRNWLIGFYIKEYEQKGHDRAKYGQQVIARLAAYLEKSKIPGVAVTSLKQYRQFYETYPQIGQTLSGQFEPALLGIIPVTFLNQSKCLQKTKPLDTLSAEKLTNSLSYSHFSELIKLDDPLKRCFYEIESIRGNWSARELRRQISTLYYERLGLSKDKEKLAEMVRADVCTNKVQDVIREPYMFEFLELRQAEITEASLAEALLKQLNAFFLEMGRGFCFEASNKKILIGDQFYFVDLVLYHRILKCHFLIELKINELNHSHISQLNTYVNYYKKHEMHTGDNFPVGLLLCTEKNQALAEYALGGIDNQLFVSKYKLALPSQAEIKKFLEKKLKELPKLS